MKIKAIIKKDGAAYTVGIVPADLEGLVPDDHPEIPIPVVEQIEFCGSGPGLYNKGRQNSLASYKVRIAGSDIRRIVPESEVAEIHADVESHKKERNEKVVPELPE